ncbi:MAG: hypothetical protein VYE68_15730 [Acidobacteriota bacterium]|nr:hypothetical protein [Acidobacteriota bacterium]
MRHWLRRSLPVLGALGLLSLTSTTATAQPEHRTSWGDPDIQGVWDFRTLTPLERPAELADKEFLTEEEAAAFEAQTLDARNADRRDGADREFGIGSDVERAYNQFWWDYGTSVNDDKRTSLIVDPPTGRIPYTRAGQEQAGRFFSVLFGNVAAGPEDRALAERCILGFNAGPPMLPSAYNNNVQVFQTPDTVVILNEMVHNARIVPLDERPHVAKGIRQWVGDSRGHWEDDTLVVETMNFLGETSFPASTADLILIERFTRAEDDLLVYEFTVENPSMWTQPWTAAVPMTKSDLSLFEYACHEGNYGMTNLLAGARAEEREAGSQ